MRNRALNVFGRAAAASLIFCVILSSSVRGQEVNLQTGEISFNGPELAALLKAVESIDTSPDILLDITGKPAGEMPPYDPLVHYAGSDPKNPKHATLWMSRSLSATPTDADRNTFRAAEELAVMDTGLAGPKWKAVYDYVAGLDAKQPAGAADPYRARHALTAQIQRIFDSYKK